MPELPEVETVKRGLANLVVDKVIADVSYDWPKGFPNTQADVDEFLKGARITQISRRGKALVIGLDTEYSLLVHLKMTGQLVYVPSSESPDGSRFGAGHPNESLIGSLPDKSTRVTFTFTDTSHLYFNDQRKFGWVKLLPTHAVEDDPFIQKLGPEPLDDSFTNTIFVQQIRSRPNTTIKAALLDQAVLAGVGNIYADESLWAVKVHPATRVRDLGDDVLRKLHAALIDVLLLSIEKGGSTDRNYVNAEGKKGSYISFAKVFRRDGESCERCGSVIEKSKVAGRGTHTCPRCQQSPPE